MLPLHSGCDDYDRYDSCMVVTVEMAVTVVDVKVVMNVTDETEENTRWL